MPVPQGDRPRPKLSLAAVSRSWPGQLLLLGTLLFGLAWWLHTPLSFFVSDTGLRFLQVRELLASQWGTLSVTYPARALDPQLAHIPLYYAYSVLPDGIYLNITPFLPWLAARGYAELGVPGLLILPVLGGVATAAFVYGLARLSGLAHPRWVLWSTVAATPLLFYSLELWDHSLATASAAGGIFLAALGLQRRRRWPVLAAGVIVGLGLGQRPEMYLFAICLGAGLLGMAWPHWRLALVLAAGGVAGALPLWLWQWRWVGHPLGMALAPNLLGYGRPEAYAVPGLGPGRVIVMGRQLFYIEARDPWTFGGMLLILLGTGLVFLALRVPRWRIARGYLIGAALSLAGYGLMAAKAAQIVPLNGLLSTLPLLPLALAVLPADLDANRGRSVYGLTLLVCGLFLASMIVLWPAYGGLQWGARYLMPGVPPLVFAAFYAASGYRQAAPPEQRRPLTWLCASLLLASVVVQLAGTMVQFQIHRQTGLLRDDVAALPAEVILTNGAQLPARLADVADKQFLYVADADALADLLPRLGEASIRRFAVVPLEFVPLAVPERAGAFRVDPVAPFVYELVDAE